MVNGRFVDDAILNDFKGLGVAYETDQQHVTAKTYVPVGWKRTFSSDCVGLGTAPAGFMIISMGSR